MPRTGQFLPSFGRNTCGFSGRHSAGLEGFQHTGPREKMHVYIFVFVYTYLDTFMNIKHKRSKSWAIAEKIWTLYNELTIPNQLLLLVNIVSRMLPMEVGFDPEFPAQATWSLCRRRRCEAFLQLIARGIAHITGPGRNLC